MKGTQPVKQLFFQDVAVISSVEFSSKIGAGGLCVLWRKCINQFKHEGYDRLLKEYPVIGLPQPLDRGLFPQRSQNVFYGGVFRHNNIGARNQTFHFQPVQKAVFLCCVPGQNRGRNHVVFVCIREPMLRKGQIPPIVAEAIIFCVHIFPRPVLDSQFTEGSALLRNIVAGIVSRHGSAFPRVKRCAAANIYIYWIVNCLAVQINAVGYKYFYIRHSCCSV